MNVLVTKYSSKDNGCKRASNKLAYVAQEQQLHVQQLQAYQHQERVGFHIDPLSCTDAYEPL